MARDTYISDGTRYLNGVEYLTKEEFRRLFYFDALDPLKDIRQDRRGHRFIRHTCLACRKAYAVAVGTDPGEGNFCEECTWQLARDNASLPSLELGKVTPLNRDGVSLTSIRCKRCWVQFWLSISSSDPKSSVAYCPSCTRVRDLIQQIEVPVLTHTFEKGPERERKPWTPSEAEVKFGEQLIQGIIDDLGYARVGPRERLTVCKDSMWLLFRIFPRERRIAYREPTSIARTDWSWSYPSECMKTKPLPKMTRS